MRTGHNKIKIFTSTILLFILSFVVLFSSPASALDVTDEVIIRQVYRSPYWSDSNTPSTFVNSSRTYSNNANYSGLNYITLKTSSNYSISAPVGDYFIINGTVIAYADDPGYLNQSTFLGISTYASADCPIIDLDIDEVSSDINSATQHRSTRYTFTATCRLYNAVTTGPTVNLYLATATPQSGAIQYVVQMNAMVEAYADTSNNTLAQKLDTISNYLQNIYSDTSGILSKLGTISLDIANIYSQGEDQLDALRDIQQSQEDANDDANARYQDEKDTINNSANDAEANASGQDFNFSIPNPLQSWFGGFSDSECIDIPNLALWIHSNETHICTPWPSSVRTVMTTIVTGLVMLLLFGFIIHWVKKNDTGGN